MANAMSDTIMLDTNVFDALLSGKLAFDPGSPPRLVATPAQQHEIAAIPEDKAEKRAALVSLIADVEIVPAGGFSFDVDGLGFGQAEWADATFVAMLQHHQASERKSKQMENQLRDVGIAWAALKRGAILISGDANLISMLEAFGGRGQLLT